MSLPSFLPPSGQSLPFPNGDRKGGAAASVFGFMGLGFAVPFLAVKFNLNKSSYLSPEVLMLRAFCQRPHLARK